MENINSLRHVGRHVGTGRAASRHLCCLWAQQQGNSDVGLQGGEEGRMENAVAVTETNGRKAGGVGSAG